MIEPKALLPAVPRSVSKPKRQTRSAASAQVGESNASTAQMSTARLIANSPLRLCFRLSTLYDDMRNVCLGSKAALATLKCDYRSPPKAHIVCRTGHVRKVPIAEGRLLFD